MMRLFQILQRTPFTNQYYPSDPYQPLPAFQLQLAEYDLKLNVCGYYENAVENATGIFVYPPAVARQIVEYWKKRYPFADYQLKDVEPVHANA